MRILTALTYYHPHWTGLTAHAQRLAEGLAARGHAVTALAYRHEPALPAREAHAGVAVERVAPLARISRGMLSPAFLAAAARLIRAHDVTLINTPMLEAGPLAALCRAARRPCVVVHHGDLLMPAGFVNRLVEHGTTASMIAAARLADRVTTYSADYGEHSDFLAPFRPKLVAIDPPVDIPVPDSAAVAGWRRELADGDGPLIGFAGRFVEEKGGDVLLRALPLLLARRPSARLVMAVETAVVYERFFADCRPLLDGLGNRVVLLGLLRDRQRLADFYAACDVLALPSRSDCFALVQAEAMLCGTPVVASDIPGAREAVRRTGMGRLVRAEDPADLAAGLDAVLADPPRYRRPRAEIAARFDPRRVVDAYEALLSELMARTPATAPSVARGLRAAAPLPEPIAPLLRNEADFAFRRRMLELLDYLAPAAGERILDAGCGQGFALLALRALADARLVGVDRDAGRLDDARAAGVAAPLARAEVAHLPFADASFDKILCSEVLEHVEDDRAALRELHRVLRPGGTLAISVPHADYPWLWDPLNRAWRALGGRPLRGAQPAGIWSLHRRLYWPADLAQRVSEAGFAVDWIEEATHYSVPFAHFLVYGVGKPVIERGLLPARWRARADRFRGADNRGSRFDPFNAARAVLEAVDRLNDRPAARRRSTFVNVLLAARRPG